MMEAITHISDDKPLYKGERVLDMSTGKYTKAIRSECNGVYVLCSDGKIHRTYDLIHAHPDAKTLGESKARGCGECRFFAEDPIKRDGIPHAGACLKWFTASGGYGSSSGRYGLRHFTDCICPMFAERRNDD